MSSISGAGGTILYIRQNGGNIQSSTNQTSWTTLSFPVTVTNSNTAAGVLRIEFTTNLTVTSTSHSFVCNSNSIQFGSRSLKSDGTRIIISVNFVTDYPGFILNGTQLLNGYSMISVYNLFVSSVGSTLLLARGWVCGGYFGKGGTNNFIINCSSDGDISNFGGGIGGDACGSAGGVLVIRGCSSSGTIGAYGGGILGNYAGDSSGSVTCEDCWSEGVIGVEGGGIFGGYPGVNGGTVVATRCYSLNTISNKAGGIFGPYAAENTGSVSAGVCYSRGTIGVDGGGIYGNAAGTASGTTFATNCYSTGSIATAGCGIYGAGKVNGTESQCYAAGGSWTNTAANSALSGAPSSSVVGTTWVSRGLNTPYELNGFGTTPYSLVIIDSSSQLIKSYAASLQAGQTTAAAIIADASGNEFTLLQITGGVAESYPSINMNIQTGKIFTNLNTAPGTYTITVRSVGSYQITTVVLIVTAIPSPYAGCSTICTSNVINMGKLQYEFLNNRLIANTLVQNLSSSSSANKPFLSYSEYMKILTMRR